MSKMPAKKKSCFQITSVTQAQVAAIGATDDTESLEDPDESRTEDVSSEIYDVSRADYEPACDGSSSEEGLNNVGESEAGGGQMSGSPAVDFRKVSGSNPSPAQPAASVQPPAATSAAPPAGSSTVSCTSRFRVIKLDHGTGEPFRRGRWTCTEFYEKDSDSSSRTVDGIRHQTSAVAEPPADRDSGIGLTGGSVAASAPHSGQALDSSASLPRMHSVESLPQQPQNYSPRQQGPAHSSFSNMKPPAAPTQPPLALQTLPTQNVLNVGQNGPSQSGIHIQKSPIMPPSASMSYSPQPQPPAPPQQQQVVVPLGHVLGSPSSGLMQTEFYQQQKVGLPPVQAGPQPSRPGPAPVLPPSTGGASAVAQVGAAEPGDVPSADAQPLPPTVGLGDIGGSPLQVAVAPPPSLHASLGLRNVPAFTVSSSVPTTVPAVVPSASSASMPNVTSSSLPPGPSKSPFGAQSLHIPGFGLMESSGGRRFEGLTNAQSTGVSGKEGVKSLMPENLQLTTPTVNSLFGIHIPLDGEEDRNPSKAFYQAFQSDSRLRDSRAHWDSASGTNVVAIDNKIEQAMDLVKSHLMYAVREEVEVLKEQIKELFERNSVLERENAVLKSLANSEQLSQLPTQSAAATPPQPGLSQAPPPATPQQQQHQPSPTPLQQQQQQQQQPKAQLDPGQQQQQQQQQPNVSSS